MVLTRSHTGRAARAVLLALATVLAFAGVTAGSSARACSCVPPPPPEEARAQSGAVFAGEVVDLTEPADPSGTAVARVAVRDVWKGEVPEVVTVRTPVSSATCGYPFEVGRTDLVYADVDDDGHLNASLCSRSAPLDDAGEDVVALGGPTDPVPGDGAAEEATNPLPWSATGTVAVALGLLALLGAVVWLSRKRA